MYQLPKTSDDFQNYQFNYPLENGMDVKSSYYMDSDFSAFDGVGIFPFELQAKAKAKSILYAVYKKNNFLAVYGKASYDSKGQLTNFESKNKISENYVFGFDRWNEIRGVSRKLINCVPNSFTFETRPTRNSKGLITNVESELVYTYDSQDRVIEVNLRNGLFSYQYEYVGASKNIRKIIVYKSGRLSADAVYGYSNNKIVSVDCNQYMSSGNEGSIEVENHKSYSYDSNMNLSEIMFSQYKVGGVEKKIHYTFNHKYDSKGKVIESQVSRMRTQRTGNYTSGSDKAPTEFVRKYTYDEQGNWIKIEDNEGYIQRIIEYRAVGNGGDNDIYDEEEVTVNATFGQTFADYFKRHGNVLYPVHLEESGTKINTSINASFIVEKDGSLSNFDIQNNSSERKSFIANTKFQIEKLHWLPATINGKPVRCNITVNFRIENYNVIVTKDIKYTKAEYKAYIDGKDWIQFKKTESDAKSGDVNAKMQLSKMYINGIGTQKDINKGLSLLVDLCVKNLSTPQKELLNYKSELIKNSELCKKVAKVYNAEHNPIDVNQDWAAFLCEIAASLDNNDAMLEMSKRYLEGNGVPQNADMAKEYLEKLALKENDKAMLALGELHLNSLLGHFEEPKAIEWYTRAADAGNREAQEKLGYFYLNGIHVKKNKKLGKQILGIK